MSKFRDLTGQTFGKLIVIKYVGKSHGGYSLFEVHCTCNNSPNFVTYASSLVRGMRKSCGCLRHDYADKRGQEWVNKKFGNVTVVSFYGRNSYHEAFVIIKCDCGSPAKKVRLADLLIGKIKKCNRCKEYGMIGKKFGKVTVLEFAGRDKSHKARFLCQCGDHVFETDSYSLEAGRTTQCMDCARKQKYSRACDKLLTGFENLLGIEIEREVGFLTERGKKIFDGRHKNILFESDCGHWHSKPDDVENDIFKTQLAEDLGYKLIRIKNIDSEKHAMKFFRDPKNVEYIKQSFEAALNG
jgi:hypothetical protein